MLGGVASHRALVMRIATFVDQHILSVLRMVGIVMPNGGFERPFILPIPHTEASWCNKKT